MFVSIIAFGYGYYFFAQEDVTHHIQVSDCQIQQSSCKVEIDQGKFVTLDILPRGIPEIQPLSIDINLEGVDSKEVLINFEGLDIDHQLFPYPLERQNDKHFKGKGFLSLCFLREMHWLANVTVVGKEKTWKISFPFVTHRDLSD